jgi:hypothetical protein
LLRRTMYAVTMAKMPEREGMNLMVGDSGDGKD